MAPPRSATTARSPIAPAPLWRRRVHTGGAAHERLASGEVATHVRARTQPRAAPYGAAGAVQRVSAAASDARGRAAHHSPHQGPRRVREGGRQGTSSHSRHRRRKFSLVLEALLTAEQLAADGFGDHPLFFCILAESDETPRKVVGFSLYFYVYSTWAGRAMHLEDLFIDLPYRKKGIMLMTFTSSHSPHTRTARIHRVTQHTLHIVR